MLEYKKILEKYSPSPDEIKKLESVSKGISDSISSYCETKKIKAIPKLVGSFSKNTNLKDGDLDIFIAFDRSYSEEFMENEGLKIGHYVIPDAVEKYAEHPYVTGMVDGIKVDIVPCFQIEFGEKKISAVDRSILHTEYVRKNLKENQHEDVRLLKIFMKSIGVYGSEVKVSGFSGYVCEILIIAFGSFFNVIKKFSETKGSFLYPENENRFDSPVVIIDPVDNGRNAGAAVSLENLSKMKLASKLFMRNEDEKFFKIEKTEKKVEYTDRGTCIKIFRLPRPDKTDDTVYPQAVHFRNALLKIMDDYHLEPIDSEVDVNDYIDVLIESRLCTSNRINIRKGPPVDVENALAFYDKWTKTDHARGPYISGENIYVDIEEKQMNIEEIIKDNINKYSLGKNLDAYKGKIQILDIPKDGTRMKILDMFFSRSLFE
ncbi:MAG: CCA tRNA nucleotidyltransferase [Thermoplasmata archaeon]